MSPQGTYQVSSAKGEIINVLRQIDACTADAIVKLTIESTDLVNPKATYDPASAEPCSGNPFDLDFAGIKKGALVRVDIAIADQIKESLKLLTGELSITSANKAALPFLSLQTKGTQQLASFYIINVAQNDWQEAIEFEFNIGVRFVGPAGELTVFIDPKVRNGGGG